MITGRKNLSTKDEKTITGTCHRIGTYSRYFSRIRKKKKAQFLIGFAAETNHVEEYAKQKLLSKNADMIVANNVMQEGAGFGTDTNIVTFYKANNEKKQFPKLTKHEVAYEILKEAYEAKKGE